MDNYSICLLGDFNARTGIKSDFTLLDGYVCNSVQLEDIVDVVNLENFDVKTSRYNFDKNVNNYGNRLLQLCKNFEILIANGRLGTDKEKGALTCKNCSTVDYCILSPNLFSFVSDFHILPFDHMISDVHNALHIELLCNPIVTCDIENFDKNNIVKPKWDNNNCQLFNDALNADNINDLYERLDSLDVTSVTKDMINDFVVECNDIIIHAATDSNMLKEINVSEKKCRKKPKCKLSGEDGIGIADLLTQATMDQRINSYRLIMASTRAILDSDGSSGSPCVDPDLDDVFEELGLQNDQEEEEDDPRYDVVNDLQKTEREYCRLLRSILNTYGEPLRKFSSLTAEDHKVLFVGIEPILSISAMLTSKFEDVLKTWDSSASQIGNLFSSKFWNLYEDYLKNYSKARKLLEDRCTEDQSFLEFCNLRKGQTTYNLQTLLHLPVQRIPEYDKYLNDLLDETEPNHQDYEELSRATSRVKNVNLPTAVSRMILNKKEFKMKKGSGFHLDMILVGVMTFMCSLFGLPWMCPATVRTIAHVSALSVMSRHHAPGEKPKLMEVKEQRVTALVMNIVIGISLFWEPVLKAVPMAVLFGVFLYLGISSLSGVQMFKRLKLLLIPVKYHPSRGFVRRVKTMKMHLFTIIQLVLLVLLLIIKSTAAALAFPLFVILLVPLRMRGLPKIFTGQELHEVSQYSHCFYTPCGPQNEGTT
ncbi:Rho GTPase-activating protein 20 [Mytilus galloprovincialis]|uniref:Rho GTPase-activating protein 20 n=1 Tax=Mytilus galloprovincialis TaxID=29158 RepID=A0A8B6BTQ5_MYTGA|nr:Rho GTPase-activating protein 20 [Mytilus galloprovincialis]